MGIFAKFIFTAAWVFGGQVQDFPPLEQTASAGAAIRQELRVFETITRLPCIPGKDFCPGPILTARVRPHFCVEPGVYTVSVRLGLLAPSGLVGGRIWLAGNRETSLVAAFTAQPGVPAYVATALQVASEGECFIFRVETSAPAEVIAEPGVSFVTIGR